MKKIKLFVLLLLLSILINAHSKSFEESFSFLENCAAENAKLPEIVGYPFKFTADEYLSHMKFSPCELENFDGSFLVFCVQEQFHSLPVSKVVTPFETDFMMIYGLVIDKNIDETYSQLIKEKFKAEIFSEETNDYYGKAIIYKISDTQTMLYCELPELTY